MKSVTILFSLTLIILTLVACEKSAEEGYIKRCVEASNMAVKAFGGRSTKIDIFWATSHCTCRSRGLQSVLTVDEYDSLFRATKTGKTNMFRIIEKNYLNDLISKHPSRIKEFGEVRSVCVRYAKEAKSNYQRFHKNELPTLPF